MKKSQTNWEVIDSMEDKNIDFSDCPEVTPEQFSKAILRRNFKPVPISSEDVDVINQGSVDK